MHVLCLEIRAALHRSCYQFSYSSLLSLYENKTLGFGKVSLVLNGSFCVERTVAQENHSLLLAIF